MEDLEAKVLGNLGNVEVLRQLADRLHDESATKRMKTAESLCKILEEYNSAGVLGLQNSVSDFLWSVFNQTSDCALQGIHGSEEKFQAAWSLILLRLIKISLKDSELHSNTIFVSCVSNLLSNRSFKVLSYLIREYQDIAIAVVKALKEIVSLRQVLFEAVVGLMKALPAAEKVKHARFGVGKELVALPQKRKRVENFDPEVMANKKLLDTHSWEFLYKESVLKLWLAVIGDHLKENEIKVYLKLIPKVGFAQVSEPLAFSDFFLKSYDLGGNLAVLALNGLFILSTKHGLEAKLYYKKLYILLKLRLKSGKPLKPGFLKLVEISLSSHLLAGSLIASFIRLFLKESLRASLPQVQWSLALGLKCLKIHPALSKMLHNDSLTDTYDISQDDPFLSNAIQSSLWELALLKKHYNAGVVELVKEYEKPLEKIARISPGELEFEVKELPIEIRDGAYKDINLG